jgi:hypothetical protein
VSASFAAPAAKGDWQVPIVPIVPEQITKFTFTEMCQLKRNRKSKNRKLKKLSPSYCPLQNFHHLISLSYKAFRFLLNNEQRVNLINEVIFYVRSQKKQSG